VTCQDVFEQTKREKLKTENDFVVLVFSFHLSVFSLFGWQFYGKQSQ